MVSKVSNFVDCLPDGSDSFKGVVSVVVVLDPVEASIAGRLRQFDVDDELGGGQR